MKKKSLFLLLFISSSLCAMNEERQNEISPDQYSITLDDFIEKVKDIQFRWEMHCERLDPFELREKKLAEPIHEKCFKDLEIVLRKEGTEIAKKKLVVLKQLKSDYDKRNEHPIILFEETLKKYEELEKSR